MPRHPETNHFVVISSDLNYICEKLVLPKTSSYFILGHHHVWGECLHHALLQFVSCWEQNINPERKSISGSSKQPLVSNHNNFAVQPWFIGNRFVRFQSTAPSSGDAMDAKKCGDYTL